MIQTIRKKISYQIFIWSVFAICILLSIYFLSVYGPRLIIYGDSVQYWAAGKLLLGGENPYSPERVVELRHQIGKFTEFPIDAPAMVLYPPWSLPILLPFGLFDYPFSRLVWLIFNITVIVFSVRLLWALYGGSKRILFLAYLVTFTFAPTLLILGMGHITTLHLLGITGFLYFVRDSRKDRWDDILAGACVSLVLIKPQLQYLLLLALLFWVIKRRRWMIPLGSFLTILGLFIISWILDPQIIVHYWQSLTSYSLGTWITPTIGSILRWVFGWEKEWLQLVPIVIGITWLLIHWWKKHEAWNWLKEMPLLLLVCVLTVPYLWTYDMVVLLIPVIALLAAITSIQINWRLGVVISLYFTSNIFAVVLHRYINDFWFLWFPPTMLILYLITERFLREELEAQTETNLEKVLSN